ncbi:pilus assembly protein [Bradyrhizobium sp. 180]|uniref:TadE/TadG family type IV pilus assembly protein n=1 Tax=unclassified Bradyrhizobium TaxID=2631580 RepID=UPI001FFA3BD9|nr:MULTISPECIES: TadE/TadG family type IV pilus assembly protein [unclassified Bradyrhizobium]MCK1421408.1 pilus assembly protein [Bradyrhizobium sp. CW12]MCK1490259.1 pilus assembly protein [Bradyrhizobium sp. 180]MCK1527488.1 pilus assembly protein [Bradyrhizobium sp. 182]MCK1598671.1 pilus assembly protein [Bradyrhizobium sp. 164]MCK1617734.1 pilus assembly protein [Bradyrhizobium sp. 159]
MQTMSRIWWAARCAVGEFVADSRALAATEFAVIVPLMLVMFFGTVEFSSAVAIDRKVTLMARTLSDLTSQSISVGDTDMTNFFAASTGVMTPYPTTTVSATISELYVDPSTLQAHVQWSKGSAPRTEKSPVTIPTTLAVGGTYLIFSEVSYTYTPTIGYVLKNAVTLSDVAYTRPRQSTCVYYSPATACTVY